MQSGNIRIIPVSALLLVVCLILISTIKIASASGLPEEHQWSEQELIILKSLWLGGIESKKEISNRIVDHPVAVELGHRIFFDKRFSANGEVACATCHQPEKFFTDGLTTGKGISQVARNTPTIVGTSQHTWFFHDGRSDSLWSQALVPLENELEHGGNRSQYAHIVFKDPSLRQRYEILFGKMPDLGNNKRFPQQAGPVKNTLAMTSWQQMSKTDQKTITEIYVNIGKVLAAYESRLQHAASRFDQYVKAIIDNKADVMQQQLTTQEVKGLRIFISEAKCITCHSGPMLTDKEFHNISVQPLQGKEHDWGRYNGAREVVKSQFNCRSEYNDAHRKKTKARCDELEYIVMDRHETQGAIKTPSLRNVSKTAPYMHAGQYRSLREVIKHYNDPPPVVFRRSALFLQVDLSEEQFEQLEAFLKSLDSEIDTDEAWLLPPK